MFKEGLKFQKSKTFGVNTLPAGFKMCRGKEMLIKKSLSES